MTRAAALVLGSLLLALALQAQAAGPQAMASAQVWPECSWWGQVPPPACNYLQTWASWGFRGCSDEPALVVWSVLTGHAYPRSQGARVLHGEPGSPWSTGACHEESAPKDGFALYDCVRVRVEVLPLDGGPGASAEALACGTSF